MLKKYFGTDGIRGKVNDQKINGEMFFKFGLAAGTYFKNQKKNKQIAIIAKDTRLSGYTLEPALVSGLASTGMHVYTLGPLPTNGLAMLTKKMRANLGIMITASHNLFYDNGLKLFGPDGLKLSDKIEKKIENLIDAKIFHNLSNRNTIPKSGLNFLSDVKFEKNFLLLCGFEQFKEFYVRIDILEKLFLKIIENTKDKKFKINAEMMNLLGCSKENFYKLMSYMGYKKDKEKDIYVFLGEKKRKKKIIRFDKKENPFNKLLSLNLK